MALILKQQASQRLFASRVKGKTFNRPGVPPYCDDVTHTIPEAHHRHPEYADFNKRLFSFNSWAYETVQSSRRLATLGFFYTGEGDLVRCYSCSIGFKEFISTDDPLIEHARFSPGCPVLQQLTNRPKSSGNSRPGDTFENKFTDSANDQKAFNKCITDPALARIHYRKYTDRLASFTGWPANRHQTPEKLADAGFYFTGIDDIVRCFSCDGGLRSWDPLDDPWIEHSRHFPQCNFVREIKGDGYIGLIHRNYEDLIKPNVPGVHKSCVIKSRSTKGEQAPTESFLSPTEIKVQQQLLGMGFDESPVSQAIMNMRSGKEVMSVENVLDEIDRLKEKDNTRASQSTESSTKEDIVKEHQMLQNRLYCKLCQGVPSDVLYLPCQHHCCCSSCAKSSSTCQICGEYIQQKIKTFS